MVNPKYLYKEADLIKVPLKLTGCFKHLPALLKITTLVFERFTLKTPISTICV